VPPQGAEEVAEAGSEAPSAEQAEVSDQAQREENGGAVEMTPPDQPSAGHPPLEEEGDGAAATAVEATDAAASEAASAVAQAEAAEPEAPKPILLWRQQRFDRPRQRHDQRGRGGPRHGRPGDAPTGDQQAGERQGNWKKGRGGRPQDGQGEQGHRRQGKPQGERQDRRDGRPDWKGKPDNRRRDQKDGQGGKPAFQQRPREEKPARFDPDSPFAKLAALRDQLKK
jgi:ATP-dependent RNA helicase SUPV3L1/SUV3